MDLYHVLNLACLKHTGQTLPEDCANTNEWKYRRVDYEGNPSSLGEYKKGIMNGLKTWFDSGQLNCDYCYHNSKPEVLKDYRADGFLFLERSKVFNPNSSIEESTQINQAFMQLFIENYPA